MHYSFNRRPIPLLLAASAALFALLLVPYHDLWNATPLPRSIGELIYRAQVAKDHAAFLAHLAAQPAATALPVPVLGVPAGAVADTYGEPRGADRSHEGVDIFAPRGTYVVSATDGIVMRIGENRLGGTIVFVLGPGGERFYYAHLDAVDPALAVGQRVDTRTLLGRVGTSGNATGTPPHLHFGIYGQGGTRNPYERLR